MSGSGYVTSYGGRLFVPVFANNIASNSAAPGGTIYCLDAATGATIWTTTMPFATYFFYPSVDVIDSEYIIAEGARSFAIFRMSDGENVANITDVNPSLAPGAGRYFPYLVIPELKQMVCRVNNAEGTYQYITAYDLTDPTNPTVAWTYPYAEASEILSYGNGVIFVGSDEWAAYGLNATTGELLWRTPLNEQLSFSGSYSASTDSFLTGGSARYMYSFDATTGAINWCHDLGYFGYIAEGGALAYDRYYVQYINGLGYHYSCFDVRTGNELWDYNVSLASVGGFVSVPYERPAVADGKVWVGTPTVGVSSGRATVMTCLDAFTGAILYQMPQQTATPTLAYGNLFMVAGGYLWCIGESPDWSSWHNNANTDLPGVTSAAGPTTLNYKWSYQTGGPVTGSPIVVNGIMYVGSYDQNLYALNAYTGSLIWKYDIGYKVLSTPTVVDGRLYTGADNGHVLCLDANTGDLIWTSPLIATNGLDQVFGVAGLQLRSSPNVVGNLLYIGSIDGTVYALNIDDGTINWQYQTGAPIASSPAVGNGNVYILSCDLYMYALDAATGNVVWKAITPKGTNQSASLMVGLEGSPLVAPNGIVYITVNYDYKAPNTPSIMAFNATTGAIVWQFVPSSTAGTQVVLSTPVYLKDVLYIANSQYLQALNATTGSTLMVSFVGHELLASMAVSSGINGDFLYFGTVLDAEYVYNITTSVVTNETAVWNAQFNRTGYSYSGDVISPATLVNNTLLGQAVPNGAKLGYYETKAQVVSTAAIYDGMLYFGSADWSIYCCSSNVQIPTKLVVDASVDNGQISICGSLQGNIVNQPVGAPAGEPDNYAVSMGGIPSEPVTVYLRGPDGASMDMPVTTDNNGNFAATYNPTVTGDWEVVVGWDGYNFGTYQYLSTNTNESPKTVTVGSVTEPTTSPSESPNTTQTAEPTTTTSTTATPETTSTPETTATSTPTESNDANTTYYIIAADVAIIVVIAVVAVIMKRRQ
jgi:outer membrane protein assembly factor BamB